MKGRNYATREVHFCPTARGTEKNESLSTNERKRIEGGQEKRRMTKGGGEGSRVQGKIYVQIYEGEFVWRSSTKSENWQRGRKGSQVGVNFGTLIQGGKTRRKQLPNCQEVVSTVEKGPRTGASRKSLKGEKD